MRPGLNAKPGGWAAGLRLIYKPASACISLGLVDGWNVAMAGLRWLN